MAVHGAVHGEEGHYGHYDGYWITQDLSFLLICIWLNFWLKVEPALVRVRHNPTGHHLDPQPAGQRGGQYGPSGDLG